MKGTCSPSAKYCYVSNSEKNMQTNKKLVPSFFFLFFFNLKKQSPMLILLHCFKKL